MKTNNISGILLAAKNYLNQDDNIHKSEAQEIKCTYNIDKPSYCTFNNKEAYFWK